MRPEVSNPVYKSYDIRADVMLPARIYVSSMNDDTPVPILDAPVLSMLARIWTDTGEDMSLLEPDAASDVQHPDARSLTQEEITCLSTSTESIHDAFDFGINYPCFPWPEPLSPWRDYEGYQAEIDPNFRTPPGGAFWPYENQAILDAGYFNTSNVSHGDIFSFSAIGPVTNILPTSYFGCRSHDDEVIPNFRTPPRCTGHHSCSSIRGYNAEVIPCFRTPPSAGSTAPMSQPRRVYNEHPHRARLGIG
jgi:hypothetical protein